MLSQEEHLVSALPLEPAVCCCVWFQAGKRQCRSMSPLNIRLLLFTLAITGLTAVQLPDNKSVLDEKHHLK